MNAQTMISVKMDKSLKLAAQKTAGEFGLPLGTLINAMLRQVVQRREFLLVAPEVPNAYLRKALRDAEKEVPKLKGKKGYTLEQMFKELDAS